MKIFLMIQLLVSLLFYARADECTFVDNSISLMFFSGADCGGLDMYCHAVIRCNNKPDESIICKTAKSAECPDLKTCQKNNLVPKYLDANTPTYTCVKRRVAACTPHQRGFHTIVTQTDYLYADHVDKAGIQRCTQLASGTLMNFKNYLKNLGIKDNLNIINKEIKKREVEQKELALQIKEKKTKLDFLKGKELVKRLQEKNDFKSDYDKFSSNLTEHAEASAPAISNKFRRLHKDLALFVILKNKTLDEIISRYKSDEKLLRKKVKSSLSGERVKLLVELNQLVSDIEKLTLLKNGLQLRDLKRKVELPQEYLDIVNNSNGQIARFNQSLKKLYGDLERFEIRYLNKSNEVDQILKKVKKDDQVLSTERQKDEKLFRDLSFLKQIQVKMPTLKTHIDRCKNSTLFKQCVFQKQVDFRHDDCSI